jgi:hypothetical protein
MVRARGDKLSLACLFVHSAKSRMDILEGSFTIWRGPAPSAGFLNLFTFSPAVTTIPALESLRTIASQSLQSSKTRGKTGLKGASARQIRTEWHEILNPTCTS